MGFYKDNEVVLFSYRGQFSRHIIGPIKYIFFQELGPIFDLGTQYVLLNENYVSSLSQTFTLHLHSSVNECFGAGYRTLSRVEDILSTFLDLIL